MEKRFSIASAVIGSDTVFQAYLLSSKKNYLLHYNSTTTQKTFSQSNNSSPGKFLRGHLLTILMALHSSTTLFVVSSRLLQGCMKSDH